MQMVLVGEILFLEPWPDLFGGEEQAAGNDGWQAWMVTACLSEAYFILHLSLLVQKTKYDAVSIIRDFTQYAV